LTTTSSLSPAFSEACPDLFFHSSQNPDITKQSNNIPKVFPMQLQQNSICVFCGARAGQNPAYAEAARTMGRAIADQGWRLVYGAGDIGLMGEVARAAQAAGAASLGVIPTHLLALEVGKRDLTQFVVTENMHERKKVMFMNSDAVVVLPGGAGSLDEFFEVLTWAQIGLHRKPIFLLNTEGYWAPLLALLDHIIAEGFAAASMRDLFRVIDTVEALTPALKTALS
jgi:uncharacterized protein (TIGR00730 family)